ncbi:MAG TPA: 4-hydroxybenzoyl-CoA thioesterase [Planctomycetaceae bacterium]|nr:4-hydroxybenzoyl-CoA thioesterase [Planctomycetaceae bacterium]HRE99365.1 thioesterase family protein [Pirellulaceae bacterium]
MSRSFRLPARVRFSDTDAAGIMHFSAFFTYLEDAEHALLRSLGLSVCLPQPEGWSLSWPRVAADCRFSGSLRFEQAFDVELTVARLGTKSVTYRGEFLLDERSIARGEVTAVCCRIETGKPPVSLEIPAAFREALAPYVNEADG